MIQQKQAALGRSLMGSQRDAIAHVFASGGTLELIVGLAGSGKTTTLDILRAGYQDEGYRVLGTAISGQAARTLHDEAGVDSRTIASLVWRLEHGQVALDHRTVLVVDEAGMADDQGLLKLLAAVDLAGAKAIISRRPPPARRRRSRRRARSPHPPPRAGRPRAQREHPPTRAGKTPSSRPAAYR